MAELHASVEKGMSRRHMGVSSELLRMREIRRIYDHNCGTADNKLQARRKKLEHESGRAVWGFFLTILCKK